MGKTNPNKKIKVLHLTTDSKIAGTERLLLELAEKNNRDIFDMYFCTLAPLGRFHNEIEQIGLHSYALNLKGMHSILAVYTRLLKLLKREKFDIVHTHLFLSSLLGLTAAHLAGVPFCIMTRHYSDYMYLFGNFLKIKLDRLSLRLSDRVVAVSDAVAKVIEDRDKMDTSKIITIYNGIDLNKLLQQEDASKVIKEQLGISNSLIVGAVGSLQPCKGHFFLIEAMPLVIKQIPKVRFVIAGEGPLLDKLKRKVREMNLDAYVFFCGYRNDIYRIISAFDVFVQPSLQEGFGIAILEALAMGKPIVASCVGGIPEIIRDGNCSRLVPPADSYKLADAIIDILNNNLDLGKLKNEGRKIVQERFSARDMVQKYEQLYTDLVFNRKENVTETT